MKLQLNKCGTRISEINLQFIHMEQGTVGSCLCLFAIKAVNVWLNFLVRTKQKSSYFSMQGMTGSELSSSPVGHY